jgi:phosphate transport system protein
LERSLVDIRDNVLRLASMADQAIANAVRALVERDGTLAATVSQNDAQLNTLRFAVEELSYQLIATQQPNSTDLRLLVGAVSVVTNLERIGDHAAGVARLALRFIERPLPKPLVDIPEMALITREMVREAVNAFFARDVALAERVIARDKDVDALQSRVYRDLVAIMTANTNLIEVCTYLLWVSHNLERIGDRATNICERAIYVTTGELKEY